MPELNLGKVVGPQGPQGETGPAGAQGIQGPQGATGEAGKSAYQAAREGGFTGTEAEFNSVMAVINAHAGRHKAGGADPLTAADVGAVPSGVQYIPGTSADDLKIPRALVVVSSTINSELHDIVAGTYAYVDTLFYNNVSAGKTRMMQIACSYNTTNHKMAFRICAENGWQPWKQLATTDYVAQNAAPAGYGEGKKQDGIKKLFVGTGSDGAGWYRIATSSQENVSAIVTLKHVYASIGSSDVALFASLDNAGASNIKCLKCEGASPEKPSVVNNARVVSTSTGKALDVFCRAASSNTWAINIINTSGSELSLQTPTFIAADDTLPEGETLMANMEWLNPPMQLGVEYRTTERFQGKPVYALFAEFGVNRNGRVVYFGENIQSVVRGVAYAGDTLPYPLYQGTVFGDWSCWYQFERGIDPTDNIMKAKVTCFAGASMSENYKGDKVLLHYTKSE